MWKKFYTFQECKWNEKWKEINALVILILLLFEVICVRYGFALIGFARFRLLHSGVSLDFHRFVCSEKDFQTKSSLAYQWHTRFNEVFHCVKSDRTWSHSGPHSVQMRQNADQNNSEYGHFSRSVLFTKT